MVRVVRSSVRHGVRVFVCITEVLASFSSRWAAVTRMHINPLSIMKVYIERNNKHVELTRFGFRKKIATLLTLGTLKWENSFATAVFTKSGSFLSWTSRHCSEMGAPDVSGHDHFGSRHFGTY